MNQVTNGYLTKILFNKYIYHFEICCRGATPEINATEIGKKVIKLRKDIAFLEEHEELLDR